MSMDMDFNDLFILECFESPQDREYFNMFTIPSLKHFNLSSRYQFLKKSDFLVEDPNDVSKIILSLKGKDILDQFRSQGPLINTRVVVMDLSKSEEEMFEEWWKVYPTTTAWTSDDKVTKFVGSRALKNLRKADAKKRYLKLLNQGLKHEVLLGSLKYEIKMKKMDSLKKNQNQMDYFKGMESYFNQERYLLYADLYEENPGFIKGQEKILSKQKNVTDI